MTLITQFINLESTHHNVETFMVMDQANTAMAGLRNVADADQVDALMKRIREENENAGKISNLLAQPIDPRMDDDDNDALLAELQQMEVVGVEEQLLQYPTAPIGKIPTIANATTYEEEELRQLDAHYLA